MPKFTSVTTFNLKEQNYGIEMLESFYKFWPKDCCLYAFLEDYSNLDDTKVRKKIKILNFHEVIPEYKIFCQRFIHKNRTDNYRYNAIKFAYKYFAIRKAISFCKTQYLIWLDADIKTYKKIDYEFLEVLVKPEYYMSYLGRQHIKKIKNRYSETGFMIFDLYHKLHELFWMDLNEMYINGGLFNLEEWTDSWVIDHVRKKFEKKYNLGNLNISNLGLKEVGNESHVFVASILGDYMDHKKGPRKNIKWSKEFITRYKSTLENQRLNKNKEKKSN